jgi:hypothetical protein
MAPTRVKAGMGIGLKLATAVVAHMLIWNIGTVPPLSSALIEIIPGSRRIQHVIWKEKLSPYLHL